MIGKNFKDTRFSKHMTTHDIPRHRLANQQIESTKFGAAQDLVAHLGAIQAQDYAMAKWAVACRVPGATDASVEAAIDRGEIVRTHVLRPTWHFVAARDIRWMLALSAPQLDRILASMYRSLGLDPPVLRRTNAIIERALAGGRHLTRAELMAEIAREGIATDDLRAAHIMFRAEVDALVCNGPRRGKQFTYALLDERVPPGKPFSREEALGELAKRYFTSHGPATVADFSWWSGLNLTAARAAVAAAEPFLTAEKIGEQTYWLPQTGFAAPAPAPNVHFLPAFDEFMVSYKDRSASLDPAFGKATITANGIFKPIIVVDGRVAGIWKRTVKKDEVRIEMQFFPGAGWPDDSALAAAAGRFGAFLGISTMHANHGYSLLPGLGRA